MYTEYFGFREKPFSVTPNPRFFYTNPVYQEAYANLLYGIRERKGFLVLTGEVGTGKTTILRRLMDNLEGTLRFVFFYNTTLSFDELLTFTCEELGLWVDGDSRLRKIQALNKFLLEQLRRGSTGALFIDEAQNFGDDVFENLRLLSNLETASEKLLQIVLVGQPELETKLDRPELRQLRQRISSHLRLDCLGEREVGSFVNHRLSVAGYKRNDLFSQDAVRQIAFYSKGVLRLINVICDNALLIAYAASQKKVSADIIREVARDLRLEPPLPVAKKAVSQERATVRPPKVEATSPKVITSRHEAFRILTGKLPEEPKAHIENMDSPAAKTRSRDEAIRAFTDEALTAMEDLGRRPMARFAVGTLVVFLLLGGLGSVARQNKDRLQALGIEVKILLGRAGRTLGVLNDNPNEGSGIIASKQVESLSVQADRKSELSTTSGTNVEAQGAPNNNGESLGIADQSEKGVSPRYPAKGEVRVP